MSDAERQIRATIARWVAAVARGDAAAITQFYVGDARFMVPNAPAAIGHAAIENMWATLLSLPNAALDFGPDFVTVAASDDLAYEAGSYALSFDKDGARVNDRGKYVVVWKNDGGTWKAAADILNSDLPAN
jgi:uncharacterized protein (TIGR02246 family)